MAARLGVEVDAIEAARRSVIELTLAHQTTARVARKQAVKDLFGTLLASWEAGVSFDAMAKALNANGIDITTETLRGYFFELKTSAQLRTENEAHERAMSKLRQENEARQRARDLEHARELTRVGNELANNAHTANVEAAHQVASEAVLTARRSSSTVPSAAVPARRNLPPGAGTASRPQSGKSTRSTGHDAGTINVDSGRPTTAMTMQVSAEPGRLDRAQPIDRLVQLSDCGNEADNSTATSAATTADGLHCGQARTLDEIARLSNGQQESAFAENLVLKDGSTVWCESGKPFEGYLSPRTLHTLRTVGKVIAPTVGRTAKDFVQMSHEL